MTVSEAAALIADPRVDGTTWADLGCGDGTFTRALATLLASGSLVHAMDRDRAALRRIPATQDGTTILTHVGDFTRLPWPFSGLDGVLMANSLHYVADPRGWLRACETALTRQRFLIVEYDTRKANPWVPYPLDREALTALFQEAGYQRVDILRSRPSLYGRAPLYAAVIDVN